MFQFDASGFAHSSEKVPQSFFRPGRGSKRSGLYSRAGKRLLDCLFVLAALPVALPLIAFLALLVKRDGGSAFYVQERLGLDGRKFRLLKLRTMIHDADRVLEDYLAANPAARQEWDLKQKLHQDPRITRSGHILRKTSLDELPQLLNVLLGDMSLVGPRPMMPEQASLYPGQDYNRLRPGITGPWQVSDRNESSFAARASFDSSYYKEMSLLGDLSLLVRTVGVVLRGTGC